MKKIVVLFIFLIIFFPSCTLFSYYEHYRIEENWKNRKGNKDDGVWVYAPFSYTRSIKTIIPFFYDEVSDREPFSCHFTIWGNFENLKSVNAKFILNGNTEIIIPLDIKRMNDQRKKSGNDRYYFPAGKIKLDFKWDEIETLVLKTEFLATRTDGLSKKYMVEQTFIKQFNKHYEMNFWYILSSA